MKRTKEIVEQLIAEGYTYKGHSPTFSSGSGITVIYFGKEYVIRERGRFHNRKSYGRGQSIDQPVLDKVIEVANSK